MPEIEDGASVEVQGSAKDPYILKNHGGVYSCSCPAWRNQSVHIDRRTCKHLRKYLGEEFEKARLGGELTPTPRAVTKAVKSSLPGAVATDATADAGEEFPILLAQKWTADMDISGWWMSEKLDGVRAYWDGKQFVSRKGNVFLAPDWFIEDLPTDVHLDGELWLARKAFQQAVSIVRRQDKSDEWRKIKFLVFDAPSIDDVFEARMAYIRERLDEIGTKYAEPHAHGRCNGIDHLAQELARVEALGGEGLMLRQPGSKYETRRSFTLLKVKTFHDAEARVIEHLPGTGRHKGRLGALSVELANGTRFSVGTGFSDQERESPPAIGSIITFRFQELSDGGVPRFPTYVRLRTDVDTLPESPVATSQATTAAAAGHPTAASADHRATAATAATAKAKTNGAVSTAASGAIAASKTGAVAVAEIASHSEEDSASATATDDDERADSATLSQSSEGNKPAAAVKIRRFEFKEGSSNKFWQIKVTATDVTVQFGKIGTAGMEKTKSFPTPVAAQKYGDEIIDEKLKKGYSETS